VYVRQLPGYLLNNSMDCLVEVEAFHNATFISQRVEVVDCQTMGTSGEHLGLKLKQGGTVMCYSAEAVTICLKYYLCLELHNHPL